MNDKSCLSILMYLIGFYLLFSSTFPVGNPGLYSDPLSRSRYNFLLPDFVFEH